MHFHGYSPSAMAGQNVAAGGSAIVGASRLHGLGQFTEDLTGTYKPIHDFVKDFKPQKRVSEYVGKWATSKQQINKYNKCAPEMMAMRFVKFRKCFLDVKILEITFGRFGGVVSSAN